MTFYIRTYGCQMNERDSEAVACLLEENGYKQVETEAEADIILINTCSVRAAAENKALGKAGVLVRLKRRNPSLIIGIIGCMAQNQGGEILRKVPHVDLVVGTDMIHMLPQILAEVGAGKSGQVCIESCSNGAESLHGHRSGNLSAFVAVMRGCNQFCTYCIVPYVRGRERSRPAGEIVEEVRSVVATGAKEICLLGQNITAYGAVEARLDHRFDIERDSPFAELLFAVAAVPGVERIRFTSPHPRFMNERFIDAVVSIPSVCEAFHLPLQSGSERILKAMHRGYTVQKYMSIVAKLRQRKTNCSLSTDVIVGFPGETEADFAATRAVMNEAGFDMAYIFKYSPRTGTRAAAMTDDVPIAVKEERNQILLADLDRRAVERNRSFIGRQVEVLVEGPSARNPQRWSGRSRENKVCLFSRQEVLDVGDIRRMIVKEATPSSLFGDLLAV